MNHSRVDKGNRRIYIVVQMYNWAQDLVFLG